MDGDRSDPIAAQPDARPAAAVAVDAAEDVQKLLADLDEEDRALVLMRFAENHDYDELAERFDSTAGALRMRISRIRERLAVRAGR
jgi:DNA-directed RNA polymerase specialized sigma24 family protein